MPLSSGDYRIRGTFGISLQRNRHSKGAFKREFVPELRHHERVAVAQDGATAQKVCRCVAFELLDAGTDKDESVATFLFHQRMHNIQKLRLLKGLLQREGGYGILLLTA